MSKSLNLTSLPTLCNYAYKYVSDVRFYRKMPAIQIFSKNILFYPFFTSFNRTRAADHENLFFCLTKYFHITPEEF